MHQDLIEAACDGNIEEFQRMEGDSSFDVNLVCVAHSILTWLMKTELLT